MIYTIGDSHCRFGWENIDGVKYLHLGPKLMHSFSKDYNEIINIYNITNLPECDFIIFCFGEIDCRNHIHKYSQKRGYEKVLKSLVSSYIDAILDIRIKTNNSNNIKFGVYMIPPPSREKEERYHDRLNIKYDNPFPFVGTDEERKTYHLFANNIIKSLCEENNLLFINPYEKYCDEDGFLNKDLSDQDSYIHIKNEMFLLEELKLKGLK